MCITHVVSFSGGRTSAYLVHLMEEQRKAGNNVCYIFMDTGCEHPLTYRFIREVVKFWDIPLTVLQVDINPELGQPNGYTEWEPKDIQTRMPVLKPFMDMVKKYGTPYIGGAFCTDRLKLIPFTKYCDNHFGRGNYITWLGIRADEPSRLKPKSGAGILPSYQILISRMLSDGGENNLLICKSRSISGTVFSASKSQRKSWGLHVKTNLV